MAHEPITSDPGILMGKPTLAGTRITVELVLDKLAAGESPNQILSEHPRLTPGAIRAATAFAADVLRADVVYPMGKSPGEACRGGERRQAQVVDRLRASGYEVRYAAELDPGIDDKAVLLHSLQAGAVVAAALDAHMGTNRALDLLYFLSARSDCAGRSSRGIALADVSAAWFRVSRRSGTLFPGLPTIRSEPARHSEG